MDAERINPAGLARPSGFSHAVSAPAGRMVFLAGQTGVDRDGNVADLDGLTEGDRGGWLGRGNRGEGEDATGCTGAPRKHQGEHYTDDQGHNYPLPRIRADGWRSR